MRPKSASPARLPAGCVRQDLRPVEQATIFLRTRGDRFAHALVKAYTALARNGDVIDLTLFKRKPGETVSATQVFKPETARA